MSTELSTSHDTSGVVFAVVVLIAAVVVGYAAGGGLGRLGELSLRRGWLVAVALVAQVAAAVLSDDVGDSLGDGVGDRFPLYPLGLALSALLVSAFLFLNRGVRGTGLVALGLLSNALVVGLNAAMPVSGKASGRAGISTQVILSGADPRHELAGPGTHLAILGDVIPVLLPRHPEVVSVGDVLVAAGLAQLVVAGMTRRPGTRGSGRRFSQR